MKKILCSLWFLLVLSVACFAQLVLPGDYPDPSVTKTPDAYWASATTSNWGPVFPLLRSDDLIHWETKGFVFNTLPAWADYYFWAPEIEYDKGKTFVYYSAHKKDGNLCLAVASADNPEGPYTDHGPIMCQQAGSIDAFPMRDKNGTLHLIWKEDGNSIGQPTPIWISEMKEDRSGLSGEKRELFRNDQPWEANLVEGVSMIRQGEYFYAFYAAAGCCGKECTYATGVARAKDLPGPWEKYEKNPLIVSDDRWICPGHGTPVRKDGKFFFLYHAYEKYGGVFTGRQGLLKEFVFTSDNWIAFKDDQTFSDIPVSPVIREEFAEPDLSNRWQWSVFGRPQINIRSGHLELMAVNEDETVFLGQKTYKKDYHARATVVLNESNAEAGLAAIGDDKNLVGIAVTKKGLKVWKTQAGKTSVLAEEEVSLKNNIEFQMTVRNGSQITFSYKKGNRFVVLNDVPVDGTFLPPWDRAVRAGITSKGQNDQKAVFENFILYH